MLYNVNVLSIFTLNSHYVQVLGWFQYAQGSLGIRLAWHMQKLALNHGHTSQERPLLPLILFVFVGGYLRAECTMLLLLHHPLLSDLTARGEATMTHG